MNNELKNPVVVYPTDLLEQAIFAAALQNYNRDRVAGCGVGFGVSGTDLDEARYLLTSSELDFQNYIPEDPKIPLIVMETSTVAKDRPMVKRLSDIPFGDLKIGDKVISKKNNHGVIEALTPITEASRREDNEIRIRWSNSSESYNWQFMMNHVQYVGVVG